MRSCNWGFPFSGLSNLLLVRSTFIVYLTGESFLWFFSTKDVFFWLGILIICLVCVQVYLYFILYLLLYFSPILKWYLQSWTDVYIGTSKHLKHFFHCQLCDFCLYCLDEKVIWFSNYSLLYISYDKFEDVDNIDKEINT